MRSGYGREVKRVDETMTIGKRDRRWKEMVEWSVVDEDAIKDEKEKSL